MRIAIALAAVAALILASGCHEGAHGDPCRDVTCSGHGTCSAPDRLTPACTCEPGYHAEGLDCLAGEPDGDADGDVDADADADLDTDADGPPDGDPDGIEQDADEDTPPYPPLSDTRVVGEGQDPVAVPFGTLGVLVDYLQDLTNPAIAADARDLINLKVLLWDASGIRMRGETTFDPSGGAGDAEPSHAIRAAYCGEDDSGQPWALVWHRLVDSSVLLAVSIDRTGNLIVTNVTTRVLNLTGSVHPMVGRLVRSEPGPGCYVAWIALAPDGHSWVMASRVQDPAALNESYGLLLEGTTSDFRAGSDREGDEPLAFWAASDGQNGLVVAVPGVQLGEPGVRAQRRGPDGTLLWTPAEGRLVFDGRATEVPGAGALDLVVNPRDNAMAVDENYVHFLATANTDMLPVQRCMYYGQIRLGDGAVGTLPQEPIAGCAGDLQTDADIAVTGARGVDPVIATWTWDGSSPGSGRLVAFTPEPVERAIPGVYFPRIVPDRGGTVFARWIQGAVGAFELALLPFAVSAAEIAPLADWPEAGLVLFGPVDGRSIWAQVPRTPAPVLSADGGAVQVVCTEQGTEGESRLRRIEARAVLPPDAGGASL